jgi:hypothetical protein
MVLACRRTRSPPLLRRGRQVHGRAASRDRHRARRRSRGSSSGERRGDVRRHGADTRADRHHHDVRRAPGFAHPPRPAGREEGRSRSLVLRASPSTRFRTSTSVSESERTRTSIRSLCFRRGIRRALPRLPRRRPHQLRRRARRQHPRPRPPRMPPLLPPLLLLLLWRRHPPQSRAPSPSRWRRSPSPSRRSRSPAVRTASGPAPLSAPAVPDRSALRWRRRGPGRPRRTGRADPLLVRAPPRGEPGTPLARLG